jgi:hypothetical protein
MKPLLVLMIAGLVACGSGTPTATDSGITGTVTYGPTCPVEQMGAPPCETPYATQIIVSRVGKAVTTVNSGKDGRFRVSLAPGTYTLSAKSTGVGGMQPQEVVVYAHSFTSVNLTVDSGIR